MSDSDSLSGAQEIQNMLVTYAKQETIDPLKTLGRYLGFGIIGSFFIAFGVFFIGLGILRFTQSQEIFRDGSDWFSTIPYLITTAVLIGFLLVISISLVRAKQKVRGAPK